jgi:Ran GTPase-activating protein (RanGAP) involved in mRNA processing and transport
MSLQDLFGNYNHNSVAKIDLSGNSHAEEACQWIAQNILAKSPALRELQFSDMFTTRLKDSVKPNL